MNQGNSNHKNKGGFIVHRHHAAGNSLSLSPPPSMENNKMMGMRQLFDEASSTYTYLLWDKDTEDAIIVDPVATHSDRDLLVATELNLVYCGNTHCHDDHISGTRVLKHKCSGCRSFISRASAAQADEHLEDLDEIHFGHRFITAITTPGHTKGCMSFVLDDHKAILTGDALLVRGFGGCSAESGGSLELLYASFHENEVIKNLPDDCVVFPGHETRKGDYETGRTFSTLGFERSHNPLFTSPSKEAFIRSHATLGRFLPPHPKRMDAANLSANMYEGMDPFFVPGMRTRLKDSWGIYG